ncbi:hypothetical protein H6P81_018014 [Aristolochia fimbriata]|uniref:Gnk2-homologous domain-containing protein n=1 Tax=Aristolochia fimbriata TaxID=158543 RepID=A0AAV7DZU3_ARIFI|nr:hypothetical protein H6P81_018014 [Aristolochia fimbriata]
MDGLSNFATNLDLLLPSLVCKASSSGCENDSRGSGGDEVYGSLTCTENVSNPDRFYMVLTKMMNGLASAAAADPCRFATKAVHLDAFSNIYGLTQCTPTLSRVNCYRCLQEKTLAQRICCDSKVGGRIINLNCYSRHERYPFYDPRRSPTNNPTSSAPTGIKSKGMSG